MKTALKLIFASFAIVALVALAGCSGGSDVANTTQSVSNRQTEANMENVRPEVKKFCDDYEACLSEYYAFMATYDNTDPKQIEKYNSLNIKFLKFAQEAEEFKGTDLNPDEKVYFLEAQGNVSVRMAEANSNKASAIVGQK